MYRPVTFWVSGSSGPDSCRRKTTRSVDGDANSLRLLSEAREVRHGLLKIGVRGSVRVYACEDAVVVAVESGLKED